MKEEEMGKQLFDGMHHYGVMCRDINESIAFYRDALGFEFMFSAEENEGEDHVKIAFMKIDTLIVKLMEPASWNQEACDWASQGLNHIALGVGDLDAMRDRLIKEYNIVFTDPEDGPECKADFFRGPGGERLELIQVKTDMFPVAHSPSDSPEVRGLTHIGVFSGNIDDSITFYKDVLGFELINAFEEGGPDMPFWNKLAMMRLGNAVLEILCPIAHPQIREKIKYQARMQMTYVAMNAAKDMKEIIDAIKEQCDVEWENTTPTISAGASESNDLKCVFFRDLNGYRWGITQDLGNK